MMLAQELQKAEQPNQSAPYYRQLSHLRTKIYNAPAYPWNMKTIAAEQNISLSHLTSLQQYFGSSCLKDIIQARLELAQMYLRQSDMTVQHIVFNVDNDNELHFMRQFKKKLGMTPTEFRERLPHP